MNNLNNAKKIIGHFKTQEVQDEKAEVEVLEINEISTRDKSFETEITITYNGKEFKPSKKHNELISLSELLDEIKKYESLSKYEASQKIKISRKWFNYIVADYFAVSEHIIDNLDNCEHKKILKYILNELKEIIAVNNSDYKRGFLINSNDIKNKIIKFIIEEAKYRFTEFNGGASNLFDTLFKNLPEQLYLFSDKFKELIKILKAFKHENIAIEIERICDKAKNLKENPWINGIKSTITLCNDLRELLNSENVIFTIENIQNEEEIIGKIEEGNSDLSNIEQTINFDDIPDISYIRDLCRKKGFTTYKQYIYYVEKTLFGRNTDLKLKEDSN